MNSGNMKICNTKNRGITLIALVVTIVIMLILAGLVVNSLFNEESTIKYAQESIFKARIQQLKEKIEIKNIENFERTSRINKNSINVGPTLLKLVKENAERFNISETDILGEKADLESILGTLNNQEEKYLVIYHGELNYVSMDDITNNDKLTEWCKQIGIPVLDFRSTHIETDIDTPTPEPIQYQIAYDLGGGTADNPTYYYDTSETFSLDAPTKTGYTFSGWTGSNGETAQVNVTIEKGSMGDKTYTANWIANKLYLSAEVQLGDYVDYTPVTSSCTIAKANSGYSRDQTFSTVANTKWRVFSIDENNKKVTIIPEEPISNTALNLWGKAGYINYTTILDSIGALYGTGAGAQKGRSMTLADVEQYSTYDTSNYVHTGWQNKKIGDTRTYSEGTFINEQGVDEGINPFTATQTQYRYEAKNYFSNSTIYNMIFKKTSNTSENKIPYFLSTRGTVLYNIEVNYAVYAISNGWIESGPIGNTSNNSKLYLSGSRSNSTNNTIYAYVMPIVELQEGLCTTGKNENNAWTFDL